MAFWADARNCQANFSNCKAYCCAPWTQRWLAQPPCRWKASFSQPLSSFSRLLTAAELRLPRQLQILYFRRLGSLHLRPEDLARPQLLPQLPQTLRQLDLRLSTLLNLFFQLQARLPRLSFLHLVFAQIQQRALRRRQSLAELALIQKILIIDHLHLKSQWLHLCLLCHPLLQLFSLSFS